MRHALHDLMGSEVDVDAAEATYTGVLREVTEETVTLWSTSGWVSIPQNQVKGVRPARKRPVPSGQAGPGRSGL